MVSEFVTAVYRFAEQHILSIYQLTVNSSVLVHIRPVSDYRLLRCRSYR